MSPDGRSRRRLPDSFDPVRHGLGAAALLAAFVGGLAVTLRYPTALSPTAVRELVANAGPSAPLVFAALQAVQVVAAPLPGQVLAGVGGYLFGSGSGALYSMLGVVLGSYVVFTVSRRYGRSLLVTYLDESTVQRFDRFGAENGPAALFVFFLLPTFPDDLLCAVAGLWNLRPRTFVALLVVGRAPSFFVAAFLGSSVQSGAHFRATVGLTALGLVVLVVYVLRDRIEEHLTA